MWGMSIEDANNAMLVTRINALKAVVRKATASRERAVLNKLVRFYREDKLTQEQAYASIMLIAELRSAEAGIGKDDLDL